MTIQCNQVTKSYTHDLILDHITMKITPGEHIAIVGENGCGKSTLLKIIAGLEPIQEGEIIKPRQCKIAYLSQHFEQFSGTVYDYLMQSYAELVSLQEKMRGLEEAMMTNDPDEMAKTLERYGVLQQQFEHAQGYEITAMIDQIANGLQIAHVLHQSYEPLSGGEKVRVNLARNLLIKPDVLLLDEPTNHLDFQGIRWLEHYIHALKQTVIVISHDRMFLNHTVEKLYEIECGELICYHGNYDAYRTQKKERYERLMQDFELQRQEIKKLQDAIRRFRQWGHEGDNEKFFKKAKMLEKRLAAMERLKEPKELQREMNLSITAMEQGSKQVLQLIDVKKSFGERTLFEHVDLTLLRKERVAITGANGTGKSTLIQLLMQKAQPDEGSIVIGPNVKIGYLPQMIHFPDESKRLLDYARYALELHEEQTRRYLSRFGFDQIDMMKRLRMLSGGERTRLALACIVQREVNVIIMDEPTNHLDFSSIEIIETTLRAYPGTLLLVSHDRMFIQTLCDRVWSLENGTIKALTQFNYD